MRTTRGFRRTAAVVAGLASTLTLAACGSDDSATATAATAGEAADVFPITLENFYGETVIEAEPTRVATWGWGSTEAAIAAGVYPVAVAEQLWTAGEGNLLPWVEEAYDEAGVEHPVVLNDDAGGAEIPYEEFIAATPDLIVAPYSGLTEEQYEQLSEIAPVVAFTEGPWTTPWDETIRLTATALGREEKGEEILDEIHAYMAEEAAAHPEFAGTTVAGIWAAPTTLSVYTGIDPRVGVLTELGFEVAPSVAELDTSDNGFYFELSWEKADALESDLIVSYHSTQEEADAMLTDEKALTIPAVGAGAVAQMVGPANVSSVSPPTALSFQWEKGMPALVDKLAVALRD
ncbi:iron-siderophore ABC transporter substrate-binding protein [Nocardioides sp. GY 10113]|uniref:iron-siderophore ABC transporter substrate-binding protein n=1 Tax=Nocardioides sp. GY 10113 TaxID=2569761 RepID=UPI0010A801BE|nr:iron-siderophore ABC transporter substrate-binding protein [Nocardioides sp. GY 10113]TIC81501.1 iron-siderophore ABC transporter substrate-binding protein [Nocardioides sp. GY 10113]